MENKNVKTDIIYVSAGIIVTGILFVIFPGTDIKTICYIIAGILAILGIVKLITYFKRDRMEIFSSYDLVTAAVMLVLAIYIGAKPDTMAHVVNVLIGLVMIADGFLKVQHTIDLLRIKNGKWIIMMIAAVIGLAAGVTVLLNPFDTWSRLMIFAGILFMVMGAANIVFVILISRRIKHIKAEMIRMMDEPRQPEEATEE